MTWTGRTGRTLITWKLIDITKMIIKKLSEDITYKAETAEIVVEVNGKKVRICDWYKQSDYGENDADIDVDQDDRDKLTEMEDELLGDVLQDIRDMKIDEEMKVDDWEDEVK